jgi:hypothetical protein
LLADERARKRRELLDATHGEIKRRTDVGGIFPNEDAITRLVRALLLEQNDEWAVLRGRYVTLETIRPSRRPRRCYTTYRDTIPRRAKPVAPCLGRWIRRWPV